MTSKIFSKTWDIPFVVLPRTLAQPMDGIANATLAFLADIGLPRSLVYGNNEWPAHLSFSRIEQGLVPLLQTLPPNDNWPQVWEHHFVLGQEWFEGGASPLWCLHGPSGRVVVIDIEADENEPRLVNTSVQHLAETLMAFRMWSLLTTEKRQPSRLRTSLEQSDPKAWTSSRWSALVDYLESVNVENIICKADDV